jgi:hypothetical protein
MKNATHGCKGIIQTKTKLLKAGIIIKSLCFSTKPEKVTDSQPLTIEK